MNVGEDLPDERGVIVAVVGVFSGEEEPLQVRPLGAVPLTVCVAGRQASDGAYRSCARRDESPGRPPTGCR